MIKEIDVLDKIDVIYKIIYKMLSLEEIHAYKHNSSFMDGLWGGRPRLDHYWGYSEKGITL